MNAQIMLAAFGGLVVNLLSLLEIRNVPKERRPDFRDFFYWLPFLAWPAMGSVLAFAYEASGVQLNPILAINVGVSTPLILRSMAEANPFKTNVIDPGEGA